MSAKAGKYASFYLPNGSSIAFTSEACELVSGYTYKITDIKKRYWDDQNAVTVYENGVPSIRESSSKAED
jgi:hypothetical protein